MLNFSNVKTPQQAKFSLKIFIILLNLNELNHLVAPMKRQREQVRLNNLEILIAETGSAAKVAQLAGTSESYLSQVRRKMPTQKGTPRGLGDELAARLEQGLGKPQGWMDEPHEDETVSSDTHQFVRVGHRVLQIGGERLTVRRSAHDQRSQETDTAEPAEDQMESSATNQQKDAVKPGRPGSRQGIPAASSLPMQNSENSQKPAQKPVLRSSRYAP